MAKKKGSAPVAFNSAQAKAKWDSLEGRVDASLEALVAGKAKPQDIQNIGQALKGMSNAAHQVFEEAVDAAKANADAAARAAEAAGQSLTPEEHTQALNKALAPKITDLLKQIQDIIEIENTAQTEELKDFIGRGFDDLYSAIPHPEDIEEALENAEDVNADEGTEDRVATHSDFMKLYDRLGHVAAAGALAIGALELKLEAGFDKIYKFLSNKKEQETEESLAEALTDASRSGTAASPSSGVVQDPNNATGGKSDVQAREDESDKASTWWKALLGLEGGTKKKEKKKKGNWLTDILKDMGTMGILTSIFDPEFWTTLGKKLEESVTWENLKNAFFTSWDWIKDRTSDTMAWILDKLGITGKSGTAFNDVHSDTNLTPNAQKSFDSMTPAEQLAATGGPEAQAAFILNQKDEKGNLSDKGKTLLSVAPPATKEAYKRMRYDAEGRTHRFGRALTKTQNFFTGKGNEDDGFSDTVEDKYNPKDPAWNPQTQSVLGSNPSSAATTVPQSTPKPQRASLAQTPPTAPSGTQVSVSTSQSQNGTTVPLPGVGAADPGRGQLKPPLPVAGAASVGLGSFGFIEGTSDGLLLMNSTLLGGH